MLDDLPSPAGGEPYLPAVSRADSEPGCDAPPGRPPAPGPRQVHAVASACLDATLRVERDLADLRRLVEGLRP